MSDPARRAFKLHLPGLLKVLAEHLYSSKHVALRELIQNAHDSCTRRAAETNDPGYRPRIDLWIERQNRRLFIRDNGSGLTAEEIENYLATIGRSYTRELRENLSALSPLEAANLIGQFGFGFLSAFLVASEVRLSTRSVKPGAEALEWRSGGGEDYTLGPGAHDEPGTTIELFLKPGAAFLTQPGLLTENVQKFADFLPIPIHLAGDPVPLNAMGPPWRDERPGAATLEHIARAFGGEPLWVLALHDHELDLGYDAMTVPLEGFLFVPASSVASVREYGDLRVYIRRMFITDEEKRLLPDWARFVRGVVDCPLLQPTASREGIHEDDTFEAVAQAIEGQLADGLRRLAAEDPAVWRRVVEGHRDVITGWAVKNRQFFDAVADIVSFKTSRGELPLPDYLALTDGTLYYVSRELGSLQEKLIAEGHDVPVIDASWFSVLPFLEAYAARQPDVSLVQLDGEASRLLRSVAQAPFSGVLERYRSRGVNARVAAFSPPDVPALMLYPQGADLALEARAALGGGELADPLASLVGDYLERRGPSEEELKGTLYLNASNPLVRRLADTPPGPVLEAALTLMYQTARLFAGRAMTTADAALAYREIGAAMGSLLP